MPQLITPDGMRAQSKPQGVQVVDVGRNPEMKQMMLSGRLPLVAPFIYHDPSKEIAYVLMPMELNLRDTDQQRVIGQLTQVIMRSLPENAPRGYLLQPKTFFTFQSLVEAILEKDGITPEMLKAQEEKANLLRDLIRASDEDTLRQMARQNDDKIDADLFDLLAASIDANVQSGREQGAQQLARVQNILIEETSFGKKVGKRLDALETFQKSPTRETLLAQLIAAPDVETRETLVAMGRQLLDYAFFQALSGKIDAASVEQKPALIGLRKEVQDIRDKMDAAQREYISQKGKLIETILTSKDPMKTAQENAQLIDETFLAVVQANAQQAQKNNDKQLLDAMQAVYEIAMEIMAQRQPPEVQFINALVTAKSEDEQIAMLKEAAGQGLDDRIIPVMGQLADQLSQEDRTDLAGKLTQLMVTAREILPKYNAASAGAPAPAPEQGGGLVGADGLIRGSNEPPPPAAPKIEIARR